MDALSLETSYLACDFPDCHDRPLELPFCKERELMNTRSHTIVAIAVGIVLGGVASVDTDLKFILKQNL